MSVAPGSRLGVYEILGPLGAGGMGEVWRARDTRLEREVAVKVLPPAFASDPARLARFEREARAVAALSHPNVLSIFDVGRHDEQSFVVTELLEGATLRAALAARRLPVSKAVDVWWSAWSARVARRARSCSGSRTATPSRCAACSRTRR